MGNDAIILSGTGFLVYFTKVTGVKPAAWVFAQFTICNIASAVLVSRCVCAPGACDAWPRVLILTWHPRSSPPASNITNLVCTSTFHINFLSYTAWMILPSLASAVAGFLFLLFVEFRHDVPARLDPVDVNARDALVDLEGAVWGSAVFVLALVALVAGSAVDVLGGVWQVTVPAAVLVLARDVYHDIRQDARTRAPLNNDAQPSAAAAHESAAGIELAPLPPSAASSSSTTSVAPLRPHGARQASARLPTTAPQRAQEADAEGGDREGLKRVSLASLRRQVARKFVTVSYVCERLPFNLLVRPRARTPPPVARADSALAPPPAASDSPSASACSSWSRASPRRAGRASSPAGGRPGSTSAASPAAASA